MNCDRQYCYSHLVFLMNKLSLFIVLRIDNVASTFGEHITYLSNSKNRQGRFCLLKISLIFGCFFKFQKARPTKNNKKQKVNSFQQKIRVKEWHVTSNCQNYEFEKTCTCKTLQQKIYPLLV